MKVVNIYETVYSEDLTSPARRMLTSVEIDVSKVIPGFFLAKLGSRT